MKYGLQSAQVIKLCQWRRAEGGLYFKEREMPFDEDAVFWFESRVQDNDLKYAGNPIRGIEITGTRELELESRQEYNNRIELGSDGKTINQEMVYENKQTIK